MHVSNNKTTLSAKTVACPAGEKSPRTSMTINEDEDEDVRSVRNGLFARKKSEQIRPGVSIPDF